MVLERITIFAQVHPNGSPDSSSVHAIADDLRQKIAARGILGISVQEPGKSPLLGLFIACPSSVAANRVKTEVLPTCPAVTKFVVELL